MIVSVLDTFTSTLAGCVTFSILGALAHRDGKHINEVVKGGPGLAFIAYPEALSLIPFVPQLWSVLFFIMFYILGIGSSVGQVETVLTVVRDQFTWLQNYKSLLALGACILF